MKNVLILEGSPRLNGNSHLLSDAFARGAEEAGHTVTRIAAARKRVAGCLGCNACYRNGGACVQTATWRRSGKPCWRRTSSSWPPPSTSTPCPPS